MANVLAFRANEFPSPFSFNFGIAVVAEGSSLVFNETRIGQFLVTQVALETTRMPRTIHCLDNTSNYEFITLSTTRCKKNMEIMFAIFATIKFVEFSRWKGTEALAAPNIIEVLKIPLM